MTQLGISSPSVVNGSQAPLGCDVPGRDGRINSMVLSPHWASSENLKSDLVLKNHVHLGSKASKILLLQGPVGPFFTELHNGLLECGMRVRRVTFNAGDNLFVRAFSHNDDCIRFSGNQDQWETWLRVEMAQSMPDAIILFGSSRPAHVIARRIAQQCNVQVVCLEEGYLRSGYIAYEIGGNNQHSPLVNWIYGHAVGTNESPKTVNRAVGTSSWLAMRIWSSLYYFARDAFSQASDDTLFHRPRERIIPLAWSWAAHTFRRGIAKAFEISRLKDLQREPGYILIPLQVGSDSQLRVAARGWDTTKLVDACLEALAQSTNQQRVVFKLHPLERSGPAIKRFVKIRAKQFGLAAHQVSVFNTGRLSDLARKASGMIVINSTSVFSALHHNVPVLVLGDAVYRHRDVVTIGESFADVADFFKLRSAMKRDVIDAFLADIKSQSLLPGDFYAAGGRKVAIKGIISRLRQPQESSLAEATGQT